MGFFTLSEEIDFEKSLSKSEISQHSVRVIIKKHILVKVTSFLEKCIQGLNQPLFLGDHFVKNNIFVKNYNHIKLSF